MQLFALDSQQGLTAASHALKQTDYRCMECSGIVRVRGGPQRQPHFYHTQATRSCHLSGKTLVHLQVQWFLLQLFPPGEAVLECAFPSIRRIADVVWERQRLIFEVQCSPITAEEIQGRQRDYRSVGYEVIWLLHDQRYNRPLVTAAEQALLPFPHYFTNIDDIGYGGIYDQWSLNIRGRRTLFSGRRFVDLRRPVRVQEIDWPDELPALLAFRRDHWPIAFEEDFLHCEEGGSDWNFLMMHQPTIQPLGGWALCRLLIERLILRPYRLLFQLLLERACR